ncbi:MAG: hypothetical protein ACW98Y_07250 [Candidatus Thorarchaeota archaeon]|jgi:hypothetical protein
MTQKSQENNGEEYHRIKNGDIEKENRTDRIFLKLNEESILKGYENSRKFAEIMVGLISGVFTIYTSLASWLLGGIVLPEFLPAFLYLVPASLFILALLSALYTIKSRILYASPDDTKKIRLNYVDVIEWRDKWNKYAGWLLSVGFITMFLLLALGAFYGMPKPA